MNQTGQIDKLRTLDKKTNAPIVVPIPGGDTGMVVRQPRKAGVQFSVDGVLLASISALEKEIAIEMGDWKTKSQMEVVDGPSLVDILRDRRLRRVSGGRGGGRDISARRVSEPPLTRAKMRPSPIRARSALRR